MQTFERKSLPVSSHRRRARRLSWIRSRGTPGQAAIVRPVVFRWTMAGVAVLLGLQSVLAAPDPQAAFVRVWERYDRPVLTQGSGRSWTWGPAPTTPVMDEDYYGENPPTRFRSVQYFDKGRMEMNNPNGDPNDPWFVTSGLLPEELMFTRRQE